MNSFEKLISFLNKLDDARLYYRLDHTRPDTVMVDVAVPGERWEVEFSVDGDVEVEVFKSGGPSTGLEGEEALVRLLVENSV